MDDDGRLLAPGETGEIVIRGPNVMRGYESNPAANDAAFSDGWFRTGDQGFLDSDGYLFISGRLKELINRGGEKIAPREVDEALLAHPAVAQAVAFAIPDARLGEDVAAAVVLAADRSVEERELREFAAKRLAFFKVPRRVVVVDEIPKGPTGKLQRIGLAERLGVLPESPERGADREAHIAPRTDTERVLAGIWEEVLRCGPVGVHDGFLELGGDSVLATQVVSRAREAFDVELELIDLFEANDIAAMAQVVDGLREAKGAYGSQPAGEATER